MKEYGPEEFTDMAFSLLERAAEENPRTIVISRVVQSDRPDEIGKLAYIQICEHEIESKNEFDKWQERIQIDPIERSIQCYIEGKGLRDIKEIIKELKELNEYRIGACVSILKKLNNGEYLVKLFNNFFIVRTGLLIREKESMHRWFVVRNDRDPDMIEGTFYRVSRKEILSIVL